MTFSIVALDPATGDVGVAVASKFLAVGAIVPWARADAGAVATQSFAEVTYGPRGLEAMAGGDPATVVLEALLAADPQRDTRQVGLVDARGGVATFTGGSCMAWAGGRTGATYAAQGNILVGPEVVEAMASAFEERDGLPLAARLQHSLAAGDAAGGDRRGRQSAALIVARPYGGYGGNHDRYLDLRVDDHPAPVDELARLLDLHGLYFDRADPSTAATLGPELRSELEGILQDAGRGGDASTFADRLYGLIATENLEERWISAERIDPRVLEFLRSQR